MARQTAMRIVTLLWTAAMTAALVAANQGLAQVLLVSAFGVIRDMLHAPTFDAVDKVETTSNVVMMPCRGRVETEAQVESIAEPVVIAFTPRRAAVACEEGIRKAA